MKLKQPIMMNKGSILFFLGLIFLGLSATAQGDLSKENIAAAYRPDATSLHPSYKVYHINDSSSLVFYEINLSELHYKGLADSIHYFAQAYIHYDVYMNYKARNLVDSGSAYIEDTENYGKDVTTLGNFPIKIKEGYSYVIRLQIDDIHSNNRSVLFLDIDKNDKLGRDNFYMKASDNLPMVQSYVERNKPYRIIYRDTNVRYALVKYFKPNLDPARPPMSGGMPSKRVIRSDTTYKIRFEQGMSEEIYFPKQGFYHIYMDSTRQKGFTVFQFTSNYPFITTAMQMITPARYLSTKKEFAALVSAKNKKTAIDNFWLNLAGSKERARSMISMYYNRVQVANMLFYSDREGWMTDRGMIYIILGPPDYVYRNESMETWKYGYQKGNNGLRFDFYKADNPFTDKDFLLNRTPSYTTPWNNAIEIWRR
jgi:GWxTD domain-containing protein